MIENRFLRGGDVAGNRSSFNLAAPSEQKSARQCSTWNPLWNYPIWQNAA